MLKRCSYYTHCTFTCSRKFQCLQHLPFKWHFNSIQCVHANWHFNCLECLHLIYFSYLHLNYTSQLSRTSSIRYSLLLAITLLSSLSLQLKCETAFITYTSIYTPCIALALNYTPIQHFTCNKLTLNMFTMVTTSFVEITHYFVYKLTSTINPRHYRSYAYIDMLTYITYIHIHNILYITVKVCRTDRKLGNYLITFIEGQLLFFFPFCFS